MFYFQAADQYPPQLFPDLDSLINFGLQAANWLLPYLILYLKGLQS